MVRMSAEERREAVIAAAVTEFSRGGYFGTSTEAIAKRVGVSQPYLFRLFPGKKAIFHAAAMRCMANVKRRFETAAEGFQGEDALKAMAAEYYQLITDDPVQLHMMMQIYVSVGAAEAAGETGFGEAVRESWMDLWDTVSALLGDSAGQSVTHFMAHGMLINSVALMGFPHDHRIWDGLHISGPGSEPPPTD
ncbi:TetR/AcrR family transcriptional regulator [Streptomyces sp. NPDC127068]|uniref:TetR/AcrR family transcriptional regulator n=1 Tax=Streptomyces sp. NPDC127068 TaxID=3347127 RepID=UPI0036592AAC